MNGGESEKKGEEGMEIGETGHRLNFNKYNIKIYNYSKMVRKDKISNNKTKAVIENKSLYNSIMRDVSKTIKKHLNENIDNEYYTLFIVGDYESREIDSWYGPYSSKAEASIETEQVYEDLKDDYQEVYSHILTPEQLLDKLKMFDSSYEYYDIEDIRNEAY